MSWNIGENRNLFLKLKSKRELYHFVLTTPKTSPEKVLQTYSSGGAFYWMKEMFIIKVNFIKNGCSFLHEHFPIVPGVKNVI